MVEALGGFGACVERVEELGPALDAAFARGKPACVNVKIAQQRLPQGRDQRLSPRVELRFVTPELPRLDEIDSEVLACAVWSDARPSHGVAGLCDWRLGGRISDLSGGA